MYGFEHVCSIYVYCFEHVCNCFFVYPSLFKLFSRIEYPFFWCSFPHSFVLFFCVLHLLSVEHLVRSSCPRPVGRTRRSQGLTQPYVYLSCIVEILENKQKYERPPDSEKPWGRSFLGRMSCKSLSPHRFFRFGLPCKFSCIYLSMHC